MIRWTLAALALMGCDPDAINPGGQIGSETGAECKRVDGTSLALDEVSSLGFSPQEMLDLAAGTHVYTLRYGQLGTETELTVDVTHDTGAVEWVDYEVVYPDNGDTVLSEPALDCGDQVEIEIELGFSTADGAFAEVFDVRLQAAYAGEASVWQDLEQLSGSFDPWDHAPAGNDFDDMRAWLSATFEEGRSSGRIDGQGSGEDGEVAFAQSVDVGSWRSDDETDQ
ncbi:MAG: hypothetical protein KTR31_33155 [Myxococcales bacterium]|nr:hypothetical protein [Myxococcales bacterium]